MDLNGFLAFVAVVQHRGFSAAERATGIAKATLSRQVSDLEAALGLRLLNRTTRHVAPTDDGREIFERCHGPIHTLLEVKKYAGSRRDMPEGTLRIAAPVELGLVLAEVVLPIYMRRFPLVQADLRLGPERVDILKDDIDVAIRAGRPETPDIVRKRLGTITHFAYAAPSYLATHGPALEAGSRQHDFVVMERPGAGKAVPQTLTEAGVAVDQARIVLKTDNLTAVKLAIIRGLGIGFIPEFLASDAVQRGELVKVLPKWRGRTIEINALLPARRLLPAKTREFLEMVTMQLGHLGLRD